MPLLFDQFENSQGVNIFDNTSWQVRYIRDMSQDRKCLEPTIEGGASGASLTGPLVICQQYLVTIPSADLDPQPLMRAVLPHNDVGCEDSSTSW